MFCIVAFALLAGCASIDTKPFEQFNSSLIELNKGATSSLNAISLNAIIPSSEERYIKEVESELKQGSDELLSQLDIVIDKKNPFLVSDPPDFLGGNKIKSGVLKANLAWVDYSRLLLELASNKFVDDDGSKKFTKLATELNVNAFDAVQSFKDKPSDTSAKNTALLSNSFITAAENYINKKQKQELIEALANTQDNISAYAKDTQEAIRWLAGNINQEHGKKQENLSRDVVSLVNGNENGKNDAKIQKTLRDMIAIKTAHSNQIGSLQALHTAYGRIPAAHEALATRLSKSDSSIAAINDLLEKGVQLHSSYEATAKDNKVELVQDKAENASSTATRVENIYQNARIKYMEAKIEHILAQEALKTDPSNDTKKKDAEDKKKIADELKLEADTLKESAEALRAAATAIQESANEVKDSITND